MMVFEFMDTLCSACFVTIGSFDITFIAHHTVSYDLEDVHTHWLSFSKTCYNKTHLKEHRQHSRVQKSFKHTHMQKH